MTTQTEMLRKKSESLVIAMIGRAMSIGWWNKPSKAFSGSTPNEKWKTHPEFVYNHLVGSGMR
jgi:hypothetical protein